MVFKIKRDNIQEVGDFHREHEKRYIPIKLRFNPHEEEQIKFCEDLDKLHTLLNKINDMMASIQRISDVNGST